MEVAKTLAAVGFVDVMLDGIICHAVEVRPCWHTQAKNDTLKVR